MNYITRNLRVFIVGLGIMLYVFLSEYGSNTNLENKYSLYPLDGVGYIRIYNNFTDTMSVNSSGNKEWNFSKTSMNTVPEFHFKIEEVVGVQGEFATLDIDRETILAFNESDIIDEINNDLWVLATQTFDNITDRQKFRIICEKYCMGYSSFNVLKGDISIRTEEYQIYNNDRYYQITISYNQDYKHQYSELIESMISSFTITNISKRKNFFGIESCDKYVALMQCVIEKTPQESKEFAQQALDQTMEVWGGVDKSQLQDACDEILTQLDNVRHSYVELGCNF